MPAAAVFVGWSARKRTLIVKVAPGPRSLPKPAGAAAVRSLQFSTPSLAALTGVGVALTNSSVVAS